MGGLLFAKVARDPAPLGLAIIFSLIFFLVLLVFVGGLAQCGNLSTLWVKFTETDISYRGIFATTAIQSNSIRKIYIYGNLRYTHILFFSNTDVYMIADLLWSSKSFLKMKDALAEWCGIVGLDQPIDCELLERADKKEFKNIMKATNRRLKKNWILYATIFYFVASLPVLGHFVFPSIIK